MSPWPTFEYSDQNCDISKCHKECRHLHDCIQGKECASLSYCRWVFCNILSIWYANFNCIFIACWTTSSASPRLFTASCLPLLSPSSIPHPGTWFRRSILKEVDLNAELFVKATCQNEPLTPPLKCPLIHLPLSLPLKVLLPSSPTLTLTSAFVNNQLCDYSNEVINYWLSPPSVPQVCMLIITQWQPGDSWVERCCLEASHDPVWLGCVRCLLILTDGALTESRDTPPQHPSFYK